VYKRQDWSASPTRWRRSAANKQQDETGGVSAVRMLAAVRRPFW